MHWIADPDKYDPRSYYRYGPRQDRRIECSPRVANHALQGSLRALFVFLGGRT